MHDQPIDERAAALIAREPQSRDLERKQFGPPRDGEARPLARSPTDLPSDATAWRVRATTILTPGGLSPDEMANADLKQAVTSKAPARTKAQLIKPAARHLRSVQKQLHRARRYFQHDPVRYAA